MSRRHENDDYDHAEALERRMHREEKRAEEAALDARDAKLAEVCTCEHTRGQHQAIGLCLFCRCRQFEVKS